MKKIMLLIALAAFTTGVAQENKKKTTEKVKTTVTDSEGEETAIKEITKTEKQELALTDFDGKNNFNTVMMPVEVDRDVDYAYNGITYRFVPQETGYYIVDSNNKNERVARLYPTSQQGYYIYTQDNQSSFGYFNEDGDFVVESYDPDGDGVSNYVYKIKMNDTKIKGKKMEQKKMMKKNKMK